MAEYAINRRTLLCTIATRFPSTIDNTANNGNDRHPARHVMMPAAAAFNFLSGKTIAMTLAKIKKARHF